MVSSAIRFVADVPKLTIGVAAAVEVAADGSLAEVAGSVVAGWECW